MHLRLMAAVLVVAVSGPLLAQDSGIVLVDGINRARSEGMPLANAVRDAAMKRLRPVILTTITTIFALLPLTLNLTNGGQFWVPLGISIISGLLVASVLTLIFTPVVYTLLAGSTLRWQRQREPVAASQTVPST